MLPTVPVTARTIPAPSDHTVKAGSTGNDFTVRIVYTAQGSMDRRSGCPYANSYYGWGNLTGHGRYKGSQPCCESAASSGAMVNQDDISYR